MNSDHWSNLVPRLQLQGLINDAEYEITEPVPNNVTQAKANLMIIETEGTAGRGCIHTHSSIISYHTCHIGSWLIILYHIMSAPVYQLGANKVCLTGQLLMNAGLPGIDYRISIPQYYCKHLYYHHCISSSFSLWDWVIAIIILTIMRWWYPIQIVRISTGMNYY
jgi:hypothetical protein